MMRRIYSVVIAACGACASPGASIFPPGHVPLAPGAEDYPEAGAVVLDDGATLSITWAKDTKPKHLVGIVRRRVRFKILRESGLRVAQGKIPVDGFSSVTRVLGRAVAMGGKVTSMEAFSARGVVRRDVDVTSNALRYVQFYIPNAQVGGVVEYYYEQIFSRLELLPPWIFARAHPVLRAELEVTAPKGVVVDYRHVVGDKLTARPPQLERTRDGQQRLRFVEQDLAPVHPEPSMPHPSRVSVWVAFRVRPSTQDNISWADAAADFMSLNTKKLDVEAEGSFLKRYQFIRDTVRSPQVDGLGVLPAISAKAMLAGKPASSRDATLLLQNALVGTEMEARVALLSTSAGPPVLPGFEGLYPFVKAVVAIRIPRGFSKRLICQQKREQALCTQKPGTWVFADPTCRTCQLGELAPRFQRGRAMLLLGGDVAWVDYDTAAIHSNTSTTELNLQLGAKGEVEGKWSMNIRGGPAHEMRDALRAAKGKARKQAVYDALFSSVEGWRVRRVSYQNVTQPERELKLSGKLEGSLSRGNQVGEFFLQLEALLGPAYVGDDRVNRRYPAMSVGPYTWQTSAVLTLPVGFTWEIPPPLRMEIQDAQYTLEMSRRERDVRITRTFALKAHNLTPNRWRRLMDFVDEIREVERAAARIALVD